MQSLRRMGRFGRTLLRRIIPLMAMVMGGGIILLVVAASWFPSAVGEHSALASVRAGIPQRFVLGGDLSHHCAVFPAEARQSYLAQISTISHPPKPESPPDGLDAPPLFDQSTARLGWAPDIPGRFAPPENIPDGRDQSPIQDAEHDEEADHPPANDDPRGKDEDVRIQKLPLPGEIITDYGWVRCRTLDEWLFHPGVDIAAAEGTQVRAVASGEVAGVKDDPAMGTTVVVELADGRRLVHAALKLAAVEPGQTVRRGDPLGEVGPSPPGSAVLPPHLHWEVRCPEGHPLPPPRSDQTDPPS